MLTTILTPKTALRQKRGQFSKSVDRPSACPSHALRRLFSARRCGIEAPRALFGPGPPPTTRRRSPHAPRGRGKAAPALQSTHGAVAASVEALGRAVGVFLRCLRRLWVQTALCRRRAKKPACLEALAAAQRPVKACATAAETGGGRVSSSCIALPVFIVASHVVP